MARSDGKHAQTARPQEAREQEKGDGGVEEGREHLLIPPERDALESGGFEGVDSAEDVAEARLVGGGEEGAALFVQRCV
jgi:hypothetical protein